MATELATALPVRAAATVAFAILREEQQSTEPAHSAIVAATIATLGLATSVAIARMRTQFGIAFSRF